MSEPVQPTKAPLLIYDIPQSVERDQILQACPGMRDLTKVDHIKGYKNRCWAATFDLYPHQVPSVAQRIVAGTEVQPPRPSGLSRQQIGEAVTTVWRVGGSTLRVKRYEDIRADFGQECLLHLPQYPIGHLEEVILAQIRDAAYAIEQISVKDSELRAMKVRLVPAAYLAKNKYILHMNQAKMHEIVRLIVAVNGLTCMGRSPLQILGHRGRVSVGERRSRLQGCQRRRQPLLQEAKKCAASPTTCTPTPVSSSHH